MAAGFSLTRMSTWSPDLTATADTDIRVYAAPSLTAGDDHHFTTAPVALRSRMRR
ncbi:MAG: hypothetical protein U0Y82_00125 [Thermoleophilia bacterium]